MTTGERIAQKRRETGLSQEQLGTELGVSRQTIYKWESDAALPEIENLTQLARRFDVPVGWLLGLEESAEKHSGELNEAQLKMVEEIAARYRPTVTKRGKRLLLGGAAILLAVLIVLFSCLFHRLNTLQENNDELRNSISSVQSSVSGVQSGVQTQIDQITGQVKEALEQQTMLTSSYTCEIKSYDLKKNTVTFAVTAVPKVARDGMKAVFTVISNEETLEQDAAGDQQLYRAELTCPLRDQISVSVSFFHDGQRETQLLKRYENLYSDTLPCWYCDGDFDGGVLDDTLLTGVYHLYKYYNSHTLTAAEITSLRVGVFRDNKLVKWLTPYTELTDKQRQQFTQAIYDGETINSFVLTEDLPLDAKATYTLVVVVTDEAERTSCYPGTIFRKKGDYWDCRSSETPILSDAGEWIF